MDLGPWPVCIHSQFLLEVICQTELISTEEGKGSGGFMGFWEELNFPNGKSIPTSSD